MQTTITEVGGRSQRRAAHCDDRHLDAFGGVKAVDRVDRPLPRRGGRPPRPQRRRKIDADQGACRAPTSATPARSHRWQGGRYPNPRDAKALGIETIYQTLALADNVDAAANLFLGRELRTRWGTLDDIAMEAESRKVMGRLNPNFRRFKEPVKSLSGGQRQSVAIARAIHFNARILIMDEPTAALGPQETAQVGELIKQLKTQGIGIFLISHDIHDVFDLADRVSVMKNGQVVGTGGRRGRHQGRRPRHDHSRPVPARRHPKLLAPARWSRLRRLPRRQPRSRLSQAVDIGCHDLVVRQAHHEVY